jgi:hypothetical protein
MKKQILVQGITDSNYPSCPTFTRKNCGKAAPVSAPWTSLYVKKLLVNAGAKLAPAVTTKTQTKTKLLFYFVFGSFYHQINKPDDKKNNKDKNDLQRRANVFLVQLAGADQYNQDHGEHRPKKPDKYGLFR